MNVSDRWPVLAIRDFAEVATGGTPSTSVREYWDRGTIPWLNSGELNERRVTQSSNFITPSGLANSAARMMPEGTVLIALTGATTGLAALLRLRACGNQSVTGILPSANHDPEYLLHYLTSMRSRIISDSWGGAQKHISQAYVKDFKVPLPSLSEQRRIANVLNHAEALRVKRRDAVGQLDGLARAIFVDLFGDHRTILEKWPCKKLGEILEFLTSGSRGWAAHYAESGDLFLRIQNVRCDELSLEDVAYVQAPETAEAKRTRVQTGDVLLSITADLGRTAVVPEGIGTAFINQHLAILRTTAVVPRFLSAYFASPTGQRQVARRNRQGVKAGLNFDDIRSFVMPLPPQALQHEFAHRIGAVEKLKTAYQASLGEFNVLFATLQNRAFQGEL